jgi:hypothetical protein
MLKTQKWEPDTHPGYELHTEWQYGEGEATFVRCFQVLRNGVEIAEPDAVYALILGENQTKNRALSALQAVLPDIVPAWVFGEADGVINMTLPGATASEMLIAQAALAEFGGAVILA